MTEAEAKEVLRRRYAERGYSVSAIRRVGDQFLVSFGPRGDGRGAGPSGLTVIQCNWPPADGRAQAHAA